MNCVVRASRAAWGACVGLGLAVSAAGAAVDPDGGVAESVGGTGAVELRLGAAWDQPEKMQDSTLADAKPSRVEPEPETARDTPNPEKAASPWRIETRMWIWLMGLDGDLGVRGFETDVSASFGDVLEASDSLLGFAGRLDVGYERFGFFLDGMYADIGADDQSGPAGVASVDVSTQQGLLDFGLSYRVLEWEPAGEGAKNSRDTSLELYGGGRYNDIRIEFDPANLDRRSGDEGWVDPIVGARAVLPVSERWHFEVNGDIGGFGAESDFTWSTTAVVGYSFELFGLPSAAFFGYRAIGWDYSSGSGTDEFVWQMTQHGPILGMSVRF